MACAGYWTPTPWTSSTSTPPRAGVSPSGVAPPRSAPPRAWTWRTTRNRRSLGTCSPASATAPTWNASPTLPATPFGRRCGRTAPPRATAGSTRAARRDSASFSTRACWSATASDDDEATMITFILASFTALFVTVNPIKGAALFAVLSKDSSRAQQRRVAVRATLIASGILLIFTMFGDDLLRTIGISLAGVRVGGGILLMLLSIDIVFGHSIGPPASAGAEDQDDLSVFPLATPILAGPGAITAAVVQATEADNGILKTGLLLVALAAVMLLTLVAFLVAGRLERLLGVTGMNVVGRILGILLAAVSAEMILAGLKQSGIFASG